MDLHNKVRRHAQVGFWVTGVWLAVWIIAVLINVDLASGLDFNEWGDLIAGIASPLAFLWLVLGYLQQGHELKQNTDALRLQADELKNSVEQQRLLVQTTRDQVDAEREALNEERKRHRDSQKPRLVPLESNWSHFDEHGRSAIRIATILQNEGGSAALNIKWHFQDEQVTCTGRTTILRNETSEFTFIVCSAEKNQDHIWRVTFNDENQNRYETPFRMTVTYDEKGHSRKAEMSRMAVAPPESA